MVFFVSILLVVLVVLASWFFVEHGIWMCEDSSMVKKLGIAFGSLYIVCAVGLKLLLPPLPADRVAFSSITTTATASVQALQASPSFRLDGLTSLAPMLLGWNTGRL